MSDKTHKMIRIKWVRSGIGFTYHQKTIVRSLGLRRLNHTVVRPDTPQIRGIVAAVPHLLEIIPDPPAPWWDSVPEYTVYRPEAALVPPPTEATGTEAASDVTTTVETASEESHPPVAGETEKTAKARAAKAKPVKVAKSKPKTAEKEKSPKKGSKTAKAVKK